MTFHLMCVHIIFSSVLVAEWPSVWKELLTPYNMFSLYFDNWYFLLFKGWIWVLIAAVSGLCILFTFSTCSLI